MRITRNAWTALSVFVVACGGSVIAQSMLEQATVTAHRKAPAQVDLGDALAQQLRVPASFRVSVWANGLGKPRMMEVGADGTVYVTRRDTGDVLAVRDTNGDGRAESVTTFASNLPDVHGIDRVGSTLYLASSTTIWRTPVAAAAPEVIVAGLPDGGQHPNRMVRFGPDGLMYVSVGSSCNDCAEQNQIERATMLRYRPDGSGREVIANGLRNTIGYDWHATTQALWGMDHGSDFRGDDVPPEELNAIVVGRNYGWPICYGARIVDPVTNAMPRDIALRPGEMASKQPLSRSAFCAQTEPAIATTTAHSAPMAMRFYRGTSFPAEYRSDAFVVMRGSWNRSTPVGYSVVRVRFDAAGQPAGFEDFVTGYLAADGNAHYGRPVGLAFLPDGSMLVSDDVNGTIVRIAHAP